MTTTDAVSSVEFPALVPVPPETLAALLRDAHSRIDGAAKPIFFQPSMVVGCVTLAALIAELSALRTDAARYRWIRTHQYLGDIDPHDPCAPGSPNSIRFDRKIDGLRSEYP